jgi:metallo-beta-lactamase class B
MLLVLAALLAFDNSAASMARPIAPFHIAGNLFYVGHNEITAFLFQTPQGLILLDGGFSESTPLVERNVQSLGFKLSDVKIILNTQAHVDHAGALAALKKDTGARLFAVEADARELAAGGPEDDTPRFPPVQTDVTVADGGHVELGGFALTAHLTPGHTKGCTTWTAMIEGKPAVFHCSPSVVSPLVGNQRYPGIVEDYRKSFAIWRSLPCDWFFAAHASFFDFDAKRADPRRFDDPAGYARFLDKWEAAFGRQLEEQKRVSKPGEKR